jgi:hypothetical protein
MGLARLKLVPQFFCVTISLMVVAGIFASPANAMPSCVATGCYGPALASDGLANTTVGPNGNTVSYRFRATRSGYLKQLRVYLISNVKGYSGGTGGKLLITVNADDNTATHNPSSTRLASYLLSSPRTAKPYAAFPLITFSSPASLVAGRLYHIVFTNADARPAVNYLSVDTLYQARPTTPSQPGVTDLNSAVLLKSRYYGKGYVWLPRKGYTPLMELIYSDGYSTGMGYIEAWIGAPRAISGTQAVRERFTVSGSSRKVGTVGVRVARIRGSGSLTVRLETGTGALIDQGYIAASAMPLTKSPSYTWVQRIFSSAKTLVAGQTYHLVLQAPAGTVYQTFPIRKGYYYGFKNTTYFKDGYAQFKAGSSWVGWTQWGWKNRLDGDLQFYFGLAR